MTGRLSSQRPEPAEHPDPHRRGPAHPRGLHRAARARDRVGRLLADRAAHHGAPVAGTPALLRAFARGHGHPPRDRRARSSAWRSAEVTQRAAPLRQGDQLRPDLRHERVRPGAATSASSAARRSNYIDALLRALSRRRATTWSETRELGARAAATSRRVFGRRLYLPEINARQRAAPRAAPSARRSTRRCRARRPTSIKLAMIAVQDGLDRERLRDADDHAGARRAGVRGARRPSSTARASASCRALMAGVASCACRWWPRSASAPNWDEAH